MSSLLVSHNANQVSDIALTVNGISKTFQVGQQQINALSNVSFTVKRGVVTGLIGPDSAGKTTLMRLAVGLLLPDTGSITVLGNDAATQSLAIQSAIGYMPQRFGLYEDLTVQENLDLYADLQGVSKSVRKERYQDLMQMAELTAFTTRLAGQLSGGMKQKLGLACALIRQPSLLLLDEPTVGVDPLSRRELWAIVYRLVKEQGTSVLLSTAYLDEAERCNQVILLHDGKLLDQGAPATLRAALHGRTFAVSAPVVSKRVLQTQLAQSPAVLDALIQSEQVRIVMTREAPAPDIGKLIPNIAHAEIHAVPPRFEDSFIALLKPQPSLATPAPALRHIQTTATPILNSDSVIAVQNLSRRFGDFIAVNNVSFTVPQGEVFGLLGANGAGKSTMFRMLCGLLPPSSGSLRIAGADLRFAAATARACIGYMSQKFSLYANLSVVENLRFFSSAYGLFGKQGDVRIAWALQEFNLAPIADTVSGDLSLGYKQRLALACALMHEPRILFLDEPTSGVDPLARREFWRRINILAEQGVTIMVTTHFMEEAEYCDRLAIMASGEILTIGTPADIKLQARTAVLPDPTMEDAFVSLIEVHESQGVTT